MADEQEIRKVYVSLETRGDVRPGLEDAERAAEASQRRIEQTQTGGTAKPISPADMVSRIAQSTGENPADIARALGIKGTSGGAGGGGRTGATGASAAQNEVLRKLFATDPVAAGMSQGSVPSTMIAKLDAYQKEQASRQRIAAEDKAKERGATPQEAGAARKLMGLPTLAEEERLTKESNRQLGLFGRHTQDAWRGLDKLSRTVTGTGGLSAVLGSGGPFAMAATAAVAQVGMAQHLMSLAQSTVALTDPGRAYRLQRAQADLGASLGRGLIPLHDQMERGTRGGADWLAAHPDLIAGSERAARQLTFGMPGMILPKALEFMGRGNEGKSVGMAINPELGKVFGGGDDLYKAFAERAIMNTPAAEGGGVAAEKQEAAASKFAAAVDAFIAVIGPGAMIPFNVGAAIVK